MESQPMDATLKVSKAKTDIILDHPFFASILLGMPVTADESIKTMQTDGDSIQYNPKFVDGMTVPETVFVLAHETLHAVFQHCLRIGAKNSNKWNTATDLVINDILTKESIGTMPSGGLSDPALVAQALGVAEQVYNLLPPETEKDGEGHGGGKGFDELKSPSQDAAVIAQKEGEMKVKVANARNAAKIAGNLPGSIERLCKELLKSETDWRAVLRRFISEKSKVEYSYARPKRRFLTQDMYMPSLNGEQLGKLVIAVDCSGSIDMRLLGHFETEVRNVLEDCCPEEITVMYFDSEVKKSETFRSADEVKLTSIGGGGTAFSPIFKAIDQGETQPVACLVLTDLVCNDFGPMPAYSVLWCSTKDGDAPWGEIVIIKEPKNG